MILERVQIAGWRLYREPFAADFDQGLNLVIGSNEAGKSTLFEAMTRAIFDRHTSKAAEIRRIQPLGSSLGPEVVLTFRVEGIRYLLQKRFLREPLSRLSVERGGAWQLDHEGDRADEQVRRILGGESPRGVSKPQHRGLAQALWYLQSDPGLPAKDWSSALRDGLSGLLEATLRTPATDHLVTLLQAEFDRYFTKTGRIKQKGELAEVEVLVASLRETLQARSSELARAALYREELGAVAVERETAEKRLAAIHLRLAVLQEELQKQASLEDERTALRERLETRNQGLVRLQGHWDKIELRQKRVEEIAAEEATVAKQEEQLRTSVRELRRAAEIHARKWEDDLTPKLKTVRDKVEELKRHRRMGELHLETQQLKARLRRVEQLRRQLAERRAKLEKTKGPGDEAYREFVRVLRDADVLRARIDAGAVRVRFQQSDEVPKDAEGGDGSRIETVPLIEPVADEYYVTEPTSFRLPGFGTAEVRRADERWREDGVRYREMDERLDRQLAASGCESPGELDDLVTRRRELESSVRDLESRLRELRLGSEDESRQGSDSFRLKQLEEELALHRSSAPQPVLPGIENWVADQTQGALQSLERELARLERRIADERQAEQDAQQQCFQSNERLLEMGLRTPALTEEKRAANDRIAEELTEFGTLSALGQQLRAAGQDRAEAAQELELFLQRYALRVEKPQTEAISLAEEREALLKKLQVLRSQTTDRRARIEEVAAMGIDSQVAELEAALETTLHRRELVRCRAEASRLLRDRALLRESERSLGLTAPVTELLDGWLAHLSRDRYRGVALDETLVPRNVQMEDHKESLPLESLSHGTHEQVTVLLRLALGVLLSESERQLVVLDDRMVNADEGRMRRFCDVLEEAGLRCQVIVATCRESVYEGLEARRLRLSLDQSGGQGRHGAQARSAYESGAQTKDRAG